MVIGGNNGFVPRKSNLLFHPKLLSPRPFVYRNPLDYMNAVSIMFSYSHVSAHVYDVCNDYLQTMSKAFRDP